MDKTDSFWEWAEKELDIRRLSWYRIEKLSNLSNASIGKRARERLPPTKITCQALAKAFRVPVEYVFRKAGFLPPQTINDEEASEILALFNNLSKADQERLMIIMHSFIEAREQRDKGGDDTDVT